MNVTFDRKFVKDISILPEFVHESFARVHEACEKAVSIRDIQHCRKLESSDNLYRIRIGDYRATFILKGTNSIEFRRFLQRGQIYKRHIK